MKGRLWDPFRIGKLELKNRIVQPAMGTDYSRYGFVTQRIKDYYEARARGGAGLIIIEITYVHPAGRILEHQLAVSDDKFIPGLRELAEVIHRHGAKTALQLHHGGRVAKPGLNLTPAVAPSPVALDGSALGGSMSVLKGDTPQELTLGGIAELVRCYAEAAVRAKQAGFDGVELHCAHGYLINQFLSRSSNKRQDSYGGILENRARFMVEIIKAIKEATGVDFPVLCRINANEYAINGGSDIEEAKKIARIAQSAGADAIHVTAHGPSSPINRTSPQPACAVLEDLDEEIRKGISIPLIAVGQITPESGERMLIEGKADLIAVGRKVLADPDYWYKTATGRQEEICPCILCMGCRDDVFNPLAGGIRCTVNPTLGREAEYRIVPALNRRKVLVVGSGPGGMQAARVAALRGHQVTLWEKDGRLGGLLNQAMMPPYKCTIEPLRKYFENQLQKLGVLIELNRTATAETIVSFVPDAVVLAVGALPFTPPIPGLDGPNVVQWYDVLEGTHRVGQKVVLIGGGLVGCELAEYLVERGKQVTITNILPDMALGVGPALRGFLMERLEEQGVELFTEVQYQKVSSEGLTLTTKEGDAKMLAADTVVIAAGSIADRKLQNEISGKVANLYFVGDCIQARTIRDAIREGYQVGLEI